MKTKSNTKEKHTLREVEWLNIQRNGKSEMLLLTKRQPIYVHRVELMICNSMQ